MWLEREATMAYTVRKVAQMSGVSVRTLRFYDQEGLLKPAYSGANGYRYYEEPQLLMLQQVLFYRELGFELKKIKRILGRANFQKVAALRSHRKVLLKDVARTKKLIDTIDKTIAHLKGARTMNGEEMFEGFSVGAGKDRFAEPAKLGEQEVACKLSGRDTGGAMCIFEMTPGWPRHSHREQDEWVYVIEGQVEIEIGAKRLRVGAGESVFIPRGVPHVWSGVGEPVRVVNVYQPAGSIEAFLRELEKTRDLPTKEQVVGNSYREEQVATLHRLFDAHGMDLLGPPLVVQ